MPAILATILGTPDSEFARALAELEASHGGESVDIGLIGDVAHQSARMHRTLGFDPIDTTARELYAALRVRTREDNERLARAIGGTYPDAVSEMTPLVVAYMQSLAKKQTVWALKPAVAKKLLKNQPPLGTMKALNCRSVDSLLKHHSASELMVMSRYLETPAWNRAFTKSYDRLREQDFEVRPLEVLYIDKLAYIEPLERSTSSHRLVLHSKEMGVVAVAPTREKVIPAYTLRTVSLLLHYVNEIVAMSSLLSYMRLHKAYGAQVAAALKADTNGHVELALPIHWRSIHAHLLSTQRTSDRPLGVVEVAHTLWSSANDALREIVPTLAIWYGYGGVAKHDEEPVGYNVIDLSIDESVGSSFDDRSLKYMRRELENELLRRYLERPSISRVVLSRLGIE